MLAADSPVYDAVCFHAQQSAEKLLKAWLLEQGVPFPRTHDLAYLAAMIGGHLADLEPLSADLIWLTTFSVEIRYPGADVTQPDAERGHAIARRVHDIVASAFASETQG